MKFLCPNCGSVQFKGKQSIGKKFLSGPYKNVLFEIQCSKCFMDIPSILSENINDDKINEVKDLWIKEFKPEHLKHSSNCSKCLRKYWEIEKYLFDYNISSKDIFYQVYKPKSGAGELICKICDSSAFK